MSIARRLRSSPLHIDCAAALEAVKRSVEVQELHPQLAQADSLAEVFDYLGLAAEEEPAGGLVLRSLGDMPGDEEVFLRVIAMAVADGGSVHVRMEDGEGPGEIIKAYTYSGGALSVDWQYETVDNETGKPVRTAYDPKHGKPVSQKSGKRNRRSLLSDKDLIGTIKEYRTEKNLAVGRFSRPVTDEVWEFENAVGMVISLYEGRSIQLSWFGETGDGWQIEELDILWELELFDEFGRDPDDPQEEARKIMDKLSAALASHELRWLPLQ